MRQRPLSRRAARTRQLRGQLKAHMLTKLREAERRLGNSLGDIIVLLECVGVDEVIQDLVDPNQMHEPPAGFLKLMKNDLARCTLEQALVDFAASSLLTKLQIETAQARLALFSRAQGDSNE